MKTKITEEEKIHLEWYEEAKGMTMDDLPAFLKKLTEDYNHDYGTICHAFSAGAIATMWAMNKTETGGISGFQASCILWGIIKYWLYESNKCGLRLTNYDDMLYPQYRDKFDKTISSQIWKRIQDIAKENIKDDGELAHPAVKKHWMSIIEGKVPFGYKISDES
jgi:hypothetical protein